MKIPSPPQSESELMARASAIAGLCFADLAQELEVKVPNNFAKQKGWGGQVIETILGATAGSKPVQDFEELGIELKTIPLNNILQPAETTYVCYAPLTDIAGISWENSNVRNKLQKVLWIPVQGERSIAPKDRIIGSPILWQPNSNENKQMQNDWEELMELIALGQIESITARIGEVLQMRPKAANGKALTQAIGPDGSIIYTRPRGFYLRKNFTQSILDSVY